MTVAWLDAPKFHITQAVWFVGGEGIIRNSQHEAGTWTYLVEMELGSAPTFGRVSAEAMVLLSEVDLLEVEWQRWMN